MATRDNPYGVFNFRVEIGNDGGDDPIFAGFSDVTGLGNEVQYSEYRNGNDPESHVHKIPHMNTTDDVTLKRGIISNLRLFEWLKATREGTIDRRTVTITLLDEAGRDVCRWALENAQPKKWVGPTLAAKGGSEVAIEELHLVAEKVTFTLSS